ncbi:hypothetical protein SISSUDRAFT_769872 [Sistotremastrum suecicum HHB10207 ss-3]|uniref:Uncharacterized protein n=1 Tax=Sistotremastrum suecicum HHB10207 ss-3 TaxID=1314776 RepID=A0A166DA43_9AGAM|nr:hypothetical protein SISSUDRAFT_769872 [Sistotremastrum suecicum HHB10207 ss-3]
MSSEAIPVEYWLDVTANGHTLLFQLIVPGAPGRVGVFLGRTKSPVVGLGRFLVKLKLKDGANPPPSVTGTFELTVKGSEANLVLDFPGHIPPASFQGDGEQFNLQSQVWKGEVIHYGSSFGI